MAKLLSCITTFSCSQSVCILRLSKRGSERLYLRSSLNCDIMTVWIGYRRRRSVFFVRDSPTYLLLRPRLTTSNGFRQDSMPRLRSSSQSLTSRASTTSSPAPADRMGAIARPGMTLMAVTTMTDDLARKLIPCIRMAMPLTEVDSQEVCIVVASIPLAFSHVLGTMKAFVDAFDEFNSLFYYNST